MKRTLCMMLDVAKKKEEKILAAVLKNIRNCIHNRLADDGENWQREVLSHGQNITRLFGVSSVRLSRKLMLMY